MCGVLNSQLNSYILNGALPTGCPHELHTLCSNMDEKMGAVKCCKRNFACHSVSVLVYMPLVYMSRCAPDRLPLGS